MSRFHIGDKLFLYTNTSEAKEVVVVDVYKSREKNKEYLIKGLADEEYELANEQDLKRYFLIVNKILIKNKGRIIMKLTIN